MHFHSGKRSQRAFTGAGLIQAPGHYLFPGGFPSQPWGSGSYPLRGFDVSTLSAGSGCRGPGRTGLSEPPSRAMGSEGAPVLCPSLSTLWARGESPGPGDAGTS